MGPDVTGEDGDASDEVCTLTAIETGVDDTMVSPLSKTVTAALPVMNAPDVVIATDAEVVMPRIAVRPETLNRRVGVTDDAKKPEGYAIVMVAPEGMGMCAVGARLIVMEDLSVIRSDDAMPKYTDDVACTPGTKKQISAANSSSTKTFEKPVRYQNVLAVLVLEAPN